MVLDALLKPGSFILLLGGLIFVHELGHFLVAKALGVKVVRFSIGFGPAIWSFRRGETEYRIAILPLGGYVKMAGDDPGEEMAPEDQGRGFLEQPPWRRFLIAAAGPAMNLLFPMLIYFAINLGQNGRPEPGPVVGSVAPGSPAAVAGLRPGDRILSVALPGASATPLRYFRDLRELVSPHAGDPLTFEIERDRKTLPPITIVPTPDPEQANGIETGAPGVIGVLSNYLPAVVAPIRAGAAGPLQPFDLVVRAAGKPVAHVGELESILASASCGPIDLTVLRERPVNVPGANLSTFAPIELLGVPTCASAQRVIVPADPTVATFVAAVTPGSPAAAAGLNRGDRITAVNGTPVASVRQVEKVWSSFKPGQAVQLALEGGRQLSFTLVEQEVRDPLTREVQKRASPGFVFDQPVPVKAEALAASMVPLRRTPVEAMQLAGKEFTKIVRLTVLGIVRIFQGRISFKTIGGPIMLFSIATQAAEEGLSQFLNTMALISINLGLMNLLPIPVLDGGHLATSLAEAVTRRQLSIRAREIANLVGIILLVALMLAVFKNDIVRLIG